MTESVLQLLYLRGKKRSPYTLDRLQSQSEPPERILGRLASSLIAVPTKLSWLSLHKKVDLLTGFRVPSTLN
jgi:hypothetical protein